MLPSYATSPNDPSRVVHQASVRTFSHASCSVHTLAFTAARSGRSAVYFELLTCHIGAHHTHAMYTVFRRVLAADLAIHGDARCGDQLCDHQLYKT